MATTNKSPDFVSRASGKALDSAAQVGAQASFVGKALASVVVTLKSYTNETFRHLSDIAWGTGAIIVGGGTVGVMVLLSVSAGTSMGIEGFTGLEILGLSPLTGFIAATVATRELAPLVAALALAAQVGCRFTAQLGSMRIHEEIDALEVMAIDSLKFLVTTRVIASMMAIVPLYLIGLIGSYVAAEMSVTLIFGQAPGTYQHYFSALLTSTDVLWSVLKIVVFALAVALIHCWFGYNATGGPQGVGEATGRAIRASIVIVVVIDMIMTLTIWGSDTGVRLSG